MTRSSSSFFAYPYLSISQDSVSLNIRTLSFWLNFFSNLFFSFEITSSRILLLLFISYTEYWSLLPYCSRNLENFVLSLSSLMSYVSIIILL